MRIREQDSMERLLSRCFAVKAKYIQVGGPTTLPPHTYRIWCGVGDDTFYDLGEEIFTSKEAIELGHKVADAMGIPCEVAI